MLFLTVCLGLSVPQTTVAVDTQTARTSPQKRTTTNSAIVLLFQIQNALKTHKQKNTRIAAGVFQNS